jgi:dGTPase
MQALHLQLKRFLREKLYRHPRVRDTTDQAKEVVADLFAAYSNDPTRIPGHVPGVRKAGRSVADYIAGMTDRFALREHTRLTGKQLFQ